MLSLLDRLRHGSFLSYLSLVGFTVIFVIAGCQNQSRSEATRPTPPPGAEAGRSPGQTEGAAKKDAAAPSPAGPPPRAEGCAAPPSLATLRGATPRVADSFQRPNAGTLGSTPGGQTWQSGAGGLGIRDNTAVGLQPGDNFATIDTGQADGYLEARVTDDPGVSPGVAVRVTDPANYLRVYTDAPGTIVLRQMAGGSPTSLRSAPIDLRPEATIGVLLAGPCITVFYNDRESFTVRTEFGQHATRHGIWLPHERVRAAEFTFR